MKKKFIENSLNLEKKKNPDLREMREILKKMND